MKKAEILLSYQNVIEAPPASPAQLYAQSCSNDGVTINSWRDQWIANVKANHAKFGPFKEKSVGSLFGRYQNLPCIVAGSGPSLKGNAHLLRDRRQIPLVSCLHNFHYLEDIGAASDFYVTLDAGIVTVEEVSEGGSKSADEYWEMTKDRKLLAYIGTHPKLLENWKGEIYFYNCPVPDDAYTKAVKEIEVFNTYISTGGNVLGASMYAAKAIFGCNPIVFVGADFSFSYMHKFHAWDSKYDKELGRCTQLTDVYGVKVLTWQSYANFKSWFDYICASVPGLWVNCSEGGCLGSYPEGNISQIRQMDLSDFLKMYQLNDPIKPQCENSGIDQHTILF